MVGALVSDRPNGDIFVQAVGARTLGRGRPLEPADVAYAPAWAQELPRGNIVTVRYTGDQSEHVTVTDADLASALYGERPETIDTAFVNAADATDARESAPRPRRYPHWNIPEAPILRGLELELGAPVILDEMPAASPFEPWTPILEGWTDKITGDDWTMRSPSPTRSLRASRFRGAPSRPRPTIAGTPSTRRPTGPKRSPWRTSIAG